MRRAARLVVLAIVLATAPSAGAPNDANDSLDEADDLDDRDGDPAGDRREPDLPSPAVQVAAPPIREVLTAAYTSAGLDEDRSRSWSRRARLAGLVPLLSVRTGRDTRWQDLDPEVDRDTTIEVRATWRLDRLVFDGRELQVASIRAAHRRERRRLASQVIQAYFAWRRLTSAARVEPRWASRAEQATAELDALTDGWFSREVARIGRRR